MIRFIGCLDPKCNISNCVGQLPIIMTSHGPIALDQGLHFCDCDEYNIVCFGEIYNLDDLRKQFNIASDHRCKVIHDLFVIKGDDWIKLIDGEFTVLMYNQEEMYIYRDRHGAGPQVYYTGTHFASHPVLLRKISGFEAKPNPNTIATFLGIGYIPAPETALEGVKKIPAGHLLYQKKNEQNLRRLYRFEEFLSSTGTYKGTIEEGTEQYRQLHQQVINDRLGQVQKVGLLLSGGYDSGGNIYSLRQIYSGPAEAISIGFKDNPWTEIPLAKLMADEFKTTFHSYEIDGSEIKELPLAVKQLGDPFQEGGLMVNFIAMKTAAALGFDIILGGDGNDQHFGTSAKELGLNWRIRKMGLQWAQQLFSRLGKWSLFDTSPTLFRLRFHNDKILHIIESDCFGFPLHQARKIIPSTQLAGYEYSKVFPKDFESFDHFYFARNYLIDIEQVVNEVILFKASRMAELFGNKITFPYMATPVFNFLKTLPRSMKCKGTPEEISKGKGVAKFLHKNYLKPVLPAEITSRKKQGGFAPLPLFFKDPTQRQLIQAVIRKSGFYRQFADKRLIEAFFREYEAKALNEHAWFWYRQLSAFKYFNLLVIALWWDIHIDGMEGNLLTDFT
ncbi:MAG: asparagine synthase-related protein [Bacteroidales bacterium]